MTGWDWNKHNCMLFKEGDDNAVVFIEGVGWVINFEGVGPKIGYCPYCGDKL